MTSVFEQRLAEILQVPVYARTVVGEARASELAKEMGMGDPAPGKTTDDLALTRFPAGIPADMAEFVRDALSEYHGFDVEGDLTGKCLKVGPSDRHKPLVPREQKDTGKHRLTGPKKEEKFAEFDEVDPQDAWSKHDIVVAAWPLAAKPSREAAGPAYNQSRQNMDRGAFEDFTQTCMIELLRLIEKEEDRGDPYLPFLKLKFHHAAKSGVGATSEDNAAMGLLRSMAEAGSPAMLTKILGNKEYGMPPQVIANPDLKPRQGNRFGKHARTIIRFIGPLRDILTRHVNKATTAEVAEDLDEIRNAMLATADKINIGSVRILGAQSGQYDTVTTTHSDSPIVRWLQKVSEATTPEELEKVGGPPNNNDEAMVIYDKYKTAIASGDEHEIIKTRDEIADWLVKAGHEGLWRKRHRREGTNQVAPSGEEEPHPGVVSKDTIDNLDEVLHTKEAARAFLLAGIAIDPKTKLPKGVEWTDSAGGTQRASFIDVNELRKGNIQRAYRDYRLLIRHFGIADYPLKGTGRDPEINQALYDELTEKFMATIDGGIAAAVSVKPISKAEAIWAAEVTAGTIAADTDSQEYFQAKEDLLDFYGDTNEVAIVCPNEDVAMNLASRFASSKWVRRGCPAMKPSEIDKDKELWDGTERNPDGTAVKVDGKAGSKLGDLIGRPKAVGEIEKPEDRTGENWVKGFVGPGDIDPESRIAKMAKTLKPKLGINFDERPWADPKKDEPKKVENKVGDPATTPKGGTDGVDPPKPEKTEAREIRAAMFETFNKARRMCEYFLKHAYLTESLDAFDRKLLHEVRHSLTRGMVGTIAPSTGR